MISSDYHNKMKALVDLNKVPGLTWSDKITYLGYTLHDDTTCPLSHMFEPGWYIREILVPKHHIFIGRPHVNGHICKLVSGEVLHITEDSRVYRRAPYQMLTTQGYQMVFYTFTDIVGRTYHPNMDDCRDVQVLEDKIFETTESVLLRGKCIADQLLLEETA